MLITAQVSVMPRCTSVGAVLKAGSPLEGLQLFIAAGWEALGTIFTESFVSLVCGTGTVDFPTASFMFSVQHSQRQCNVSLDHFLNLCTTPAVCQSAWLCVQAALLGFFMLLLVFARAGGVGIVDGPAPFQTAKNEPLPASISLRCVTQVTCG